MDLLDKHSRSKDEVTETLEVSSLQGGNDSTTRLKQLVRISVTFSFLSLSAVMGLSFVLLAERTAHPTIAILPFSSESTGPVVNQMLTLNHKGSHCLLESSLEAIQQSIKNGDHVALQLKGYTDQFVAVAMDPNNNECFINAQGRSVCIKPSTDCEELPVEPRKRNLFLTDEEYDVRCKAYIASLDPLDWDYAVSFVAECVKTCDLLGCPCLCFNDDIIPEDFVVPEDFVAPDDFAEANTPEDSISDSPSSSPSYSPTREHGPPREQGQPGFFERIIDWFKNL